MKRQLIVLAILVFLCIVAAPKVIVSQNQESSATLAETVEWLRNALSSDIGNFNDEANILRFQNLLEPVDRCSLKLTSTYEFIKDGPGYQNNDRTVYQFSLSDLDPLSINIEGHGFTIKTSQMKKKIMVRSYRPNGEAWKELGETQNQDSVATNLKDEETGRRVARAFKHAIQLCGGKVDPF